MTALTDSPARPHSAPLSRRVLIIFISIMLLVTGQLVWWVIFHVRSTHEVKQERLAQLHTECALASEMIAVAAEARGAAPDLPSEILAHHFPNLVWHAGEFYHARLNTLYPGEGVFVRDDVLTRIGREHDAHIRMFVSETAFFLLMVGLGALLIVRTLRHEVSLMRQQANFLSAVTHELKSPLASIRLYTETMQLRDPPAETRTRYLRLMGEDVARLETLVGNLLAVARLDAGQFVVHNERTDLAHEVADFAKKMLREERQVPLQLEVSDAPLMVRVDPAALHTVLRNLFDNAVKYGHGAPVRLHLMREAGRAILLVQDAGIGIAPAELEKVFLKFYRVGDEMVRQAEGSGLGLYLVQALVEESRGKVSAHSEGPGKGTTIRISLPLDEGTQ